MPAPEIVRSVVTIGHITVFLNLIIPGLGEGRAGNQVTIPVEIGPDYSYATITEKVVNATRRCLDGAFREMSALEPHE